MCFRLKVENTTARKLHKCEGWLVSTDRFPNISAAPLFWAGTPESLSIDLIKGIPRFLQICRIDSNNFIHMGTPGDQWPVDSISGFRPGDYIFKVGIKGEDNAETCFYSVKLVWTGNWTTAEMAPIPIADD